MANLSLIEQLDGAVEAIIANPDAPIPSVDASVAALLRVAAELRDLPRADFKARLKADLERRASMTRAAVKPIREGFHTITPYLIVQGAAELIDFVKQAFGAEELYRGTGTAGGRAIRRSLIFSADAIFPERLPAPSPFPILD